MRADVARLAQLAGLNQADAGSPLVPWHRAVEAVGIEFPPDYREFIDLFGRGEIRGDLGIIDPYPNIPGGIDGFSRMLKRTTEDIGLEFKKMRDESFDLCPYPILPEPGGLLTWGGNYNGDLCFWLTEDLDPGQWPVIVWLRGSFPNSWIRYDVGMVEFILIAISGKDSKLRDIAYVGSESRLWVPVD